MSRLVSRQRRIWAMVMGRSTIFIRLISCLSLRKSPARSDSQDINDCARDRFIEYVLERPDIQKPWLEHTEHDFVAGLGDGTLPVESFKYYLIQDYLFLVS